MEFKFKRELGQTVKDQVTGFSGVITGMCFYLTGCVQVLVQSPVKEDRFVEPRWMDEDRVLAMDDVPILKLTVERNGPDKPAPAR